MEKIQVGEYARTRDGHIYRLLGEQKYLDKDGETVEFVEDIVKHSFNLIDLIEPKDLVRVFVEEEYDENGEMHEDTCIYEVTATEVRDFKGKKTNEIGIAGEDGSELIPFDNVRSIVTHEQFASLEYKVEEG